MTAAGAAVLQSTMSGALTATMSLVAASNDTTTTTGRDDANLTSNHRWEFLQEFSILSLR